jgi:hypothetical protein
MDFYSVALQFGLDAGHFLGAAKANNDIHGPEP